jgi:hypothetical protein
MPPLTLVKTLGGVKFLSHSLKLPGQFKAASGSPAKEHYDKCWKDEDKIAVPQLIPPWFKPAESSNKYYQDTCDKIGQNFKDFHDAMLDAIGEAHGKLKMQAKFKDIQIAAVSAIGSPGCLDGPAMESDIKNASSVASFSGNKAKHRDAVAKGVSKCFKDWADNVTVPGLPWYPAFAAFPSAMAPPMPNVPTPLIACVSSKLSSIIMPDDMKKAMDDALDGGLKDKDPEKHYEALHDAIATVCAAGFAIWVAAQTQMVMGKGPIPSFAPPYVPVGPVVGGDIISAPGHLAL